MKEKSAPRKQKRRVKTADETAAVKTTADETAAVDSFSPIENHIGERGTEKPDDFRFGASAVAPRK